MGKWCNTAISSTQKGHSVVCTMLLEHNANVNKKGKIRATPLFEAAQECHADVCTVLFEHNVQM